MADQLSRCNRYATLHTYDTEVLKKTITDMHEIDDNQVILGHGSFEILCMLSRAFGKQENSIIVPGLTFNITGAFADKVFDHKCLKIPLSTTMDIDLTATKKAISKETQLVYICNPNNPTGKILPPKDLESFCREVASPTCTIAIDEAYIELVDDSNRPEVVKLLIEKYNVLIIRTFSKAYGMAGLRVGYIIGLPETISRINKEHYSFGGLISNVGVAAAITALQDNTYIKEYQIKNESVRLYTENALKDLGIEYIPSTTNFMLIKVTYLDRFRDDLNTAKISSGPGGWVQYPEWVRLSIGTRTEMEYFINTVAKMKWLTE
jgi:histidinol-phosphate aminotransferase